MISTSQLIARLKERSEPVEKRWELVKAHPLYRDDLDHGPNFPGGSGLALSVSFESISGIKPESFNIRTNFIINHVEWCVEHCAGQFYRMRDPDRAAKAISTEGFDPATFYNYMYDVPLSVMTFELATDAIRFKLSGVDKLAAAD